MQLACMYRPLQLWDEMKAYAAEYVRSGRVPPFDRDAERWLQDQFAAHQIYAELPPTAYEFYATELRRMIREATWRSPSNLSQKRLRWSR